MNMSHIRQCRDGGAQRRRRQGGLEVMDLSEEDREGEEGAATISLGGTPSGATQA